LKERALVDRVLLVDDYEPWRRQICSLLQRSTGWQVIAEASDGLEAIQTADSHQPDVILMDVGLPRLNGIEAASRILERSPVSRILFVSEHHSCDIAEAALATGARGYIIKSDAGRELLPAMAAIVTGKRFVSTRLGGRIFENAKHEPIPEALRCHEVGFYPDDRFLLDDFARFAEATLDAGNSFIFVATESHRNDLHQRLQAQGWDIDRAIKEERFLSLDVADVLSSFSVNGWPDETRFWKAAPSLILQAARASRGQHPRVSACGECAPCLLREGKTDAAVRLEQLWDELARTYEVDVFCGYSTEISVRNEDRSVVRRLCAEHAAIHSPKQPPA
jgi:DNA-binding NarL/FixJ family response regulator